MSPLHCYLAALPPGPVSQQQVQQLVAQLLGEAERERAQAERYYRLLLRAVLNSRTLPTP